MRTKKLDKQSNGLGIKVINDQGQTICRIRLFPGKYGKSQFYPFYNSLKEAIELMELPGSVKTIEADKKGDITVKFENINKIE